MDKKILDDGSVEGETFSGSSYNGGYPSPVYGNETYRQYRNRVDKEYKEKGFHLGDLSWDDWAKYCKGSEHHDDYMQDDIIK